ncbi:hypothetical protein EV421DRAFT_1891991 [Armillaria borealis]|uniref:RNase H type-1 domain-containing protein n=1 Tax=Armillaria borealis TaxID=47425 RepID=A0AA39JA92_9AGAR|nr:hypothetical protein EV421DRAFT_1891991 [Armillaria borealis]
MTITDSKYVIEELCFHLKCWEDSNWIGISNSDVWKATIAALRQRKAPVYFQWVKCHSRADELAGQGALLEEDEAVPANVEVDHEFQVDGAKPSTLTQSQAYRLLRATKEITERSSTKVAVGRVMATIREINGVETPPSRLWKSIRSKDISRPIRGFLWKALQCTFRIGTFWEWLGPQYSKRGECPGCGVTETMEHILLECTVAGQASLWGVAKQLWEKTGHDWIMPTYGVVLGATLIQIKMPEGGVDLAATRLYHILMTETVHMIWKIRCQRRIQRGDDTPEKWHTDDEIQNMWIDVMNKRLPIDRLLVNSSRYGSKALKKKTVLSTWRGTLDNEKALPEDWTDQSGVLLLRRGGGTGPQALSFPLVPVPPLLHLVSPGDST